MLDPVRLLGPRRPLSSKRKAASRWSLGIAPGRRLESLVTLARTGSAADILLTVGGASVGGARSRQRRASLRRHGTRLLEDRHAAGEAPLYDGRLGNQRVLGVPGNPVAALICGLCVPGATPLLCSGAA